MSSHTMGFSWWQATSCHFTPANIIDDDDNEEDDDDDDDDDTVSIEVVEDGHASFVALSRVGLCSSAPEIMLDRHCHIYHHGHYIESSCHAHGYYALNLHDHDFVGQ